MPENLRSDARRNREKILAAASELFAREGAGLCMDDLARRAGVGHATVFRRFPNKEELVLAMFEDRLAAVAELVEEAAGAEDAWEGIVAAMTAIAERQARDRGLMEAVGTEVFGSPRLRAARERVIAPMGELLARAQAAGQVRDDLEPIDVFFLITAAGHASPCHFDIPDLWRRYLGVVLDGMRPAGASPLSPPAPTVAEFEAAIGNPAAASSA
jgi:AcrR family transcriptional regulator